MLYVKSKILQTKKNRVRPQSSRIGISRMTTQGSYSSSKLNGKKKIYLLKKEFKSR